MANLTKHEGALWETGACAVCDNGPTAWRFLMYLSAETAVFECPACHDESEALRLVR